jgi:hypothetical protein
LEELDRRELLEEKNTSEDNIKVDIKEKNIGVCRYLYGPWHVLVVICSLAW